MHTAAQIAAVLQQPEVLAALGAALAPFLAQQAGGAGQQAPHAAAAAPAARAGRSRSRGPRGVASAPAAPPTAEAATVAALQRQVAALHETIVLLKQELAAARGEPAGAPAKLRRAAAAAPRAPAPAAAPAAPRSQPRPNPAPGGWVLAGRQRGQKRQVSPSPACYWEGFGDARRHLMHQAGCRCIGPSGIAAPECFPPHPLAATRPYWAKEDVKYEEGVVNLNSFTIRRYVQQLEAQNPQPSSQGRSNAQPGPSQGSPRGYAAAAARPSETANRARVQVVAAPGRQKAGPQAIQPTVATLQALLPDATAVQPRRLYQGADQETLRAWGPVQVTPGRHPAEWRKPKRADAMRCVVLVGCTIHEAHLAASAVFTAHEDAGTVTAVVQVHGGGRASPTAATLLQSLRRSRDSLRIPRVALQCRVRTERLPWETADPAVVDPAPLGHVLQVSWTRPDGDHDGQPEDLPDVDPPPLADDQPATARVVCMLDPVALADADVDRLHIRRFGLEEAWRHLSPLLPQLPQRPPMNVGRHGDWMEASLDLPVDLIQVVLRASGRVRGVLYRPWVTSGEDYPHPAHIFRLERPPERRGPLPGAWKELAADEAFSGHFAGLVEGGSAGRIGVRVWGPGPSDPDVAAAAARVLGAPVPERLTSVRIRGYPAAVALSTDDYAQLRRAAAEVFGDRVPIRVRRCTQLASTTLERPVFDLLLEGVPMDWAGIFLPSVDSRVPDRVWERIVRRNQAAPYVPVGPRDRMVRVPAAGQPPAVDSPPATSSAPQPVQPEMDDVDMAAAGAAEDDVAMDGEAAGSAAELEEEDEDIL